jgi:hypothetical protein
MTTASCHDMRVFAQYMRERFLNTGIKSAAVKAVSQFAKDVPISEAVLLAIESRSRHANHASFVASSISSTIGASGVTCGNRKGGRSSGPRGFRT